MVKTILKKSVSFSDIQLARFGVTQNCSAMSRAPASHDHDPMVDLVEDLLGVTPNCSAMFRAPASYDHDAVVDLVEDLRVFVEHLPGVRTGELDVGVTRAVLMTRRGGGSQ